MDDVEVIRWRGDVVVKLYGVTEIAQALGINRDTVSQWLKRGQMPEPDERLAAGAVWSARRIEPWMERKAASGGMRYRWPTRTSGSGASTTRD